MSREMEWAREGYRAAFLEDLWCAAVKSRVFADPAMVFGRGVAEWLRENISAGELEEVFDESEVLESGGVVIDALREAGIKLDEAGVEDHWRRIGEEAWGAVDAAAPDALDDALEVGGKQLVAAAGVAE